MPDYEEVPFIGPITKGEFLYNQYVEGEMARGDLAFQPETLFCYRCKRDRAVTALGPVVEARRDPTQTYRLSCGHTEI